MITTITHRVLFPDLWLDTGGEAGVDLFAGGGGASLGYFMATGRQMDVAINHDEAAMGMHEANHPETHHIKSDIFEVDPREVMRFLGKSRLGFLWASPDCTDHSKAKGGKPIRTKKRRALAWVIQRWAGTVRPRVIMMENVEEFVDWGPLIGRPGNYRRCPRRKGKTFRRFVRNLRELGYDVEWRELRACDYGSPTIRKRLFLIARCDGKPIVWPEPTHADPRVARAKGRRPWRTAASCIDWSIPMLSIFASKEEAKAFAQQHGGGVPIRPLAENTLRRIARGVKRYVLDNPKPYLVNVANSKTTGRGPNVWDTEEPLRTITSSNGHAVVSPIVAPVTHDGQRRTPPADEPLATITAAQRGEHAIVAPMLVPRYGERAGQEPRCRSIEQPAPVIVPDGNGGSLVASHLSTYYGGEGGDNRGVDPAEPLRTQGTENRFGLIATHLNTTNNSRKPLYGADEPCNSVVADGARHNVVAAFLGQYNGGFAEGNSGDGHLLEDPASTISTKGPHQSLMAAHVQRDFGTSTGHKADNPLGTITTEGGGKANLVSSFLAKFYGQGIGQATDEPAHTITSRDRLGLVTVEIGGETYVVEDIAMRMLQPRELYRAQGFPDTYIIDRRADGKPLTKTEQVRMCGNSVCPQVAAALIRANVPEMCVMPPVQEVALAS